MQKDNPKLKIHPVELPFSGTSFWRGFHRGIFFSILFFGFFGVAEISQATYTLPADRAVVWQGNVGVSGDIPNRTIVCASIDAATYGNGTTDATNVIQNALNACPSGQVVYLPTGTYKTTGTITVPSNKTLRGAGIEQTIIKNANAVTYLVGFNNNGTLGTAHDISGGSTKDSTTITTADPHGWSAGDVILIDQLEDPTGNPPITSTGAEGVCTWCSRNNGTRPAGQLVKVLSVPTVTSAVLELPLNKTYDKTPQALKMNALTSHAGVESLSLDSIDACPNDNYGTFYDGYSENSWILNVEIINVCRIGLLMSNTYKNTVRGSVIHETAHHTSNGGYMLWMQEAGSANLVENNIFYNGLTGIIYNGALSGNVFAYNYITKMWNTNYPGRGAAGISSHGAQPWMNLFEGNYLDGPVFSNDFTWGSSAYGTYFRNRQRTDTSPEPPVNTLYGVQAATKSQYLNFVGNVFGTIGYESRYQSSDIYDGQKGIYYLADSGVTNSLVRHANWDSVNNGIVWNGSDDHSILDSLYRASAPSWWCSQSVWPPMNPVGPVVSDIPAKRRYDNAACAPISGDIIPPAAPSGLSVQ